MFKCEICDKEYKSLRSLASHKNHHNPEYKKKALKGSLGLFSEKAIESRNTHYLNLKKEKQINRKCIICETEIYDISNTSRKTCSIECQQKYRSKANSSRVMSEEGKRKYMERANPKFCQVCEVILPYKHNSKFCSKKCKSIKASFHAKKNSQKISDSLKRAFSEGRHLGFAYINRKNHSYLERSFINYLKENFPNIEYEFNKPVKNFSEEGEIKNYFYIDFFFPKSNIGLELDGTQHNYTKEYDSVRDEIIKNLHGITIHRITHKEYMSKSKKDFIDSIIGIS